MWSSLGAFGASHELKFFLEEHSSYYSHGLISFFHLILPYSVSNTYIFEFNRQNDKLAAPNFGAKVLMYQ